MVRKNLLYITETRIWPASWRYVLHAPETCAPILDTRHIPSRKDSARVSLVRSLIKHHGGWGLERLSGELERLGGNSVQNSSRTPHFHVTHIKCEIKYD